MMKLFFLILLALSVVCSMSAAQDQDDSPNVSKVPHTGHHSKFVRSVIDDQGEQERGGSVKETVSTFSRRYQQRLENQENILAVKNSSTTACNSADSIATILRIFPTALPSLIL